MLWVFIFIVVIIIIFVVVSVNFNERNKKLNSKKDELEQAGFNVDKMATDNEKYFSLYVDDKAKEWMICHLKENYERSFEFEDLLSFEIIEDDESIIKGSSGRTIIGGLMFGGLGALAGASASKKQKTTCTNLILNIVVNDLSRPNFTLSFISNETNKSSFVYKNAIEKAREFAAILKYILENAKNKEPSTASFVQEIEEKEIIASNDITNELKNIKELLEKELISQEEYDQLKKKILNL